MRKFILYFFLCLVFSLAFFASGLIESQDGLQYLAVARNIYYQHEPTAPVYEFTGGVGAGKNIHMSTHVAKNGKTYSGTGLGYSLAMLPAVALTDLVYQYYNITPTVRFPLESDWLITFLASFTNIFFASLLGVVIYLYLRDLNINHNQSLLLSVCSIFTTNLFTQAKHSYAHVMFVVFLLISFWLIKRFSINKKRVFLFLSGLSLGVVVISYNMSFVLTFPSYLLYFLFLSKPRLSGKDIKNLLLNICIIAAGVLPFLAVYQWHINLMAEAGGNVGSLAAVLQPQNIFTNLPVKLFFEGIYGQLLSPGRSFFVYTPLALIIFIFWHKIKPSIKAELIITALMSIIFIVFYATQRAFEPSLGKFVGYWNGELSWGPRYLLPLIPFCFLTVTHIYKRLSSMEKIIIFWPLALIGLFVEIIGVVIPYQTRMQEMEKDVMISGYHYTFYTYPNFLPQLSPIPITAGKLFRELKYFPKTISHGIYNVKYFDGIDFPMYIGTEKWRVVEKKGYISFDNRGGGVQNLSLTLLNHPIGDTPSSAEVSVAINQKKLPKQTIVIPVSKRANIDIPITPLSLLEKNNQLAISIKINSKKAGAEEKQIVALSSFRINGTEQNLESLDFPYISSLGPAMTGANYQNYGNPDYTNWWKAWIIHSQMLEKTPDFWWIKPIYYWDIPKKPFIILFIINVSGIVFFGLKTLKSGARIK